MLLKILSWTGLLLAFTPFAPGRCQELNDSQAPEEVYETLESEVFTISALNKRLRDETGMTNDASRQWLESRVRAVIGNGQASIEASAEANQTSRIGFETADGRTLQMSLDRAVGEHW